MRSSEGAAAALDEVLPLLKEHFEQILVAGDSDFDRADVREACMRAGAYFAFVGRSSASPPSGAAPCLGQRHQGGASTSSTDAH
jgi:hypothetical protein